MSTRCQIGFYADVEQPMDKPSALIYRHSDGYPHSDYGVIAHLLPWAKAFDEQRGLSDPHYAAARGLVALIVASESMDSVLGYEICGDHELHGDIEYFYRVDPSGITVYRTDREFFASPSWDKLKRIEKHPVKD